MKTIGTTPEGGQIVELTQDETRVFNLLENAAKGRSFDASERYGNRMEHDLSPAFHIILTFIRNMDAVILLRDRVNDLVTSLLPKEEGENVR